MKLVAALGVLMAACQPPPPAQAPCPPQTVYVAAPPREPAPVQQPPPDPYPTPAPDYTPRQPATGTQADLAAKLDAEGESLFAQRRYDEASARFRSAVARVPEAKYFHHLCQSLFYEGKFSEALTACRAVEMNNPTADLKRKNDVLTKRIIDEARAQSLNIAPP